MGVITTLAVVFVGWNSRHEKWFRDNVFPMHRDYYGDDSDDTEDGHKADTAERVERAETLAEDAADTATQTQEQIAGLRNDITDLTDDVRDHNEQERRLLRRLVFTLDRRDVVDITEVADEDDFLRGSDGGRPIRDGGEVREGEGEL